MSAMIITRDTVIDERVVRQRFDNDGDATCTLRIDELVASAFVFHRAPTLSQSDIESTLCEHHPYFRRHSAAGDVGDATVIRDLSDDVIDYSHALLAPVNISELPDGEMAVSMSSETIQTLLKGFAPDDQPEAHVDKPSKSERSSLDKLPKELDLMVFRHLCAYPGFRLSFESSNIDAMWAYPVTSATDGWVEDNAYCHLPSLTDLLGPLLVCSKNFNSLAHQTFYGLNDFQCNSLATLNSFLSSMGLEGRQCVKRVTVRYHHLKEAQKMVKMIEQCISLKTLNLIFNIRHKTNGKIEVVNDKGHGKFTYDEPSVIPGLEKLKSIFMFKKPGVVRITAWSTSQSVQKVEGYMYEGVRRSNEPGISLG